MSNDSVAPEKLVELYDLCYDYFFGLIVPMKTGIVWTNQVGGLSCCHPELEGIFIPLPGHWLPETDVLRDQWLEPEYNEHLVKEFLSKNDWLTSLFAPIPNPVAPLNQLGEAWIPVRINGHGDTLLDAFNDCDGVLTYANSD